MTGDGWDGLEELADRVPGYASRLHGRLTEQDARGVAYWAHRIQQTVEAIEWRAWTLARREGGA